MLDEQQTTALNTRLNIKPHDSSIISLGIPQKHDQNKVPVPTSSIENKTNVRAAVYPLFTLSPLEFPNLGTRETNEY